MTSYLPSLGIGAVAGMRTMTASAALSWTRPGWIVPSNRAGHARPALAATLLALAEIAGDKLPFAPDRRIAPSLAARLAIGGAGGAALADRSGGSPLTGAAYGAAGALIGTFGGRAARALTARTGLNWTGALLEDAAAIGTAVVAVRLAQEGRRRPA